MIAIKRHIPNFFTLMNIVCGFLAISVAFQGEYVTAFYLIIGAAFFDFIDGGVARLLNVQSEVGKQLDSLCDVVSFGVAPGVILFTMMLDVLGLDLSFTGMSFKSVLLLLSTLLVPAFSSLRLAIFNVDTRQTDRFIGLPVPANALFISALGAMSLLGTAPWLMSLLDNALVLAIVALFQSYLLVSPLPMFALKFKNLSWKDNRLRFLFLISAFCAIVFLAYAGIALSIIMYIFISLIISYSDR